MSKKSQLELSIMANGKSRVNSGTNEMAEEVEIPGNLNS